MARSRNRSSAGWWLALAALGVLTAVGLFAVLSLRFGGGEGYPNYSTLRADPLGARALFEAVNRLPKVESVRNFERLEKLDEKPGDVLLLLDVKAPMFNEGGPMLEGQSIAHWAAAGGRVVIAVDAESGSSNSENLYRQSVREVEEEERAKAKKDSKEDDKKEDSKKSGKPEPDEKSDDPKSKDKKDQKDTKSYSHGSSLAEMLKASLVGREFIHTNRDGAELSLAKDLPLLLDEMPKWFSNIFINDDPAQDWSALEPFNLEKWKKKVDAGEAGKHADAKAAFPAEKTEPAKPSPWKLLAYRGNRSMIMERKLGAGSVVICTDSYFASNEALWKEPKAKFLAWLIGDAHRVIFDETHLGANIGDEDNLMVLARRYRMHGLFIGALLLFVLYVWRNAVSLVPPDAAQDLGYWRDDAVAGQSAAAGLDGLLRRGVPRKQMLKRCFETWDGTAAAANGVPANRRAKARSELAAVVEMKPLSAAYRKLRDILHPARQ